MVRLLAIFCLISASAFAQGPYIIDTGPGADANIGTGLSSAGDGNPNFQFLGGRFTIASSATITAVEAWIIRGNGGSMVIHIRSNANGLPGASLFSVNTPMPNMDTTGWAVFPFSANLQAGTYWLTFEPVFNSGVIRAMPPGAPNPLPAYAFLFNFSSNWQPLTGNPSNLGMRIAGTVAPPPAVSVNTDALTFTAPQNGPQTPSKYPTITVTGAPATPFTIDGATPLPDWVVLTARAGTTPGLFGVAANPGSMPVGNYAARLRVTFQGNFTPVEIPVSLTITAPAPKVEAAPRALRFTGRTNTPRIIEQTVVLQNIGGGPPVNYQASIVGNSSWVTSVTPSSGAVGATHFFVKVTVNTQGLATGVYKDTLRLTSALGRIEIELTAAIAPAGPLLSADQTGVRFEARQGQGSSFPHVVPIRNLGDPGSSVSWTARAVRGANLVSIAPANGVSTSSTPTALTITLSNTATGTAGPKYALIEVADPQALGSPQYIVVVIDVVPNTAPVVPLPLVSGNGATLYVSSTAPVAFRTSVTNNSGLNWLRVSPATGTVSTSAPAAIAVTVNTTGLPFGVFVEQAVFEIGGVVRALPVTAVYFPATPDGPRRACTPTRVSLDAEGTPNNFSVPAGWPASLSVNLFDDCGSPIVNASVHASFSNSDPPLTLRNDGVSNNYSATWQPTNAASMEVQIFGSAGTLSPASITLGGKVNANPTPPPAISTGGIINNVYANTAGLAPGTVAAMFGTGLGGALKQATSVPLPTVIDNVEVLVSGRSAPLFYVSSGQLAAQLPTETGLGPRQVLVAVGDALTLPQPLDFVTLSPGVVPFPADPTLLVAQHITQPGAPLVSAGSPAKAGELLTIYLLGMGATVSPVASGIATPADPLPFTAVKPVVTVGGQTAELQYWGLVPSGVGLYQINFYVPAGVTGDAEVVISQSGIKANLTKLPVVP